MKKKLFISNELNNILGPLSPTIRRRLSEVHADPRAYWNRDNGLILRHASNEHLTLWQAVMRVDPSFPRTGRVTNKNGDIVKDWERYPSPELIERALLYAAPQVGGRV